MKFVIVAALPFFLFTGLSYAQAPLPSAVSSKAGEVSGRPFCGRLINRSTVNIVGTLATMPQTLNDGTEARHTINFKLSPNERKDVCASGPFYEGRRLELTIRTLIPLFQCKTRIEGDIYIDMREDSDGVKRYSATCY